jgi:Lrp/AsnC family transcriptional regulator
MDLDSIDLQLLRILQRDATATVKELAAEVGLSPNACWKRIQGFEEHGYVTKRVALLDHTRLGVGTTVIVSVKTADHSPEWVNKFTEIVRSLNEVVEFYRMSGDIDYVIKLRVSDIAHYNSIYKIIVSQMQFGDISASFVMEELKNTTEIPLGSLPPGWRYDPERPRVSPIDEK